MCSSINTAIYKYKNWKIYWSLLYSLALTHSCYFVVYVLDLLWFSVDIVLHFKKLFIEIIWGLPQRHSLLLGLLAKIRCPWCFCREDFCLLVRPLLSGLIFTWLSTWDFPWTMEVFWIMAASLLAAKSFKVGSSSEQKVHHGLDLPVWNFILGNFPPVGCCYPCNTSCWLVLFQHQ